MTKNISLLIHGPAKGEWLERIYEDVQNAKFRFKQIVLVSYADDLEYFKEKIKLLNVEESVHICSCKDVFNPGFFNINRQIRTVKAGLDFLDEDCRVIKLRNDQSVNFNKLKKHIDKLEGHRLITTNCFTRKDRLYHPSDMLLCAEYKTMRDYFSCEPMIDTHIGYIMKIQSEYKKSNGEMKALKITPESYLFRCFLNKKGWELKETQEDSINALKKYMRLVNSWDIDYRWKGKRTSYLPEKSIILPYRFTMQPFDGGPVEKCRCMNRHELAGKLPTVKDMYYMYMSIVLFDNEFSKNKNPLIVLKHILKNAHNYDRSLGKAYDNVKRFAYPFRFVLRHILKPIIKWALSPFAVMIYLLKFVISRNREINRG
jgi:hypothetical protein